MNSTIHIKDMAFYAYHGCFSEEQEIGTHFLVDISFEQDSTTAIQSDHIEDTVNYLSVYQSVKKEMQNSSKLIEHVAHRILQRLLHDYPSMQQATVKIRKMNPPLGGKMQYVAVEMTKSR